MKFYKSLSLVLTIVLISSFTFNMSKTQQVGNSISYEDTTLSIENPDSVLVQNLIQDSFDELFSSFKVDEIFNYYTEDFILLEHGEIWDIEKAKSYFNRANQNPTPPKRVNRFEFIKTEVSGDRAWVAYHNYATYSMVCREDRELQWLESATAVKTENGWRLAMLHSTRVEKK